MKKITLDHPSGFTEGEITITGSKSESNRLLILKSLFPQILIENLSNSDDTLLTNQALKTIDSIIDINHAGTAMRFLTAYFATQQNREVLLTGSQRMQERPIKLLVNALKDLGAEISYEKKDGYPPLRIKGKKITKSKVALPADISSQFVSALILIAPSLEKGLTIDLIGKLTSAPYVNMTLKILDLLGLDTEFERNQIKISASKFVKPTTWLVESDWSSASYFYSVVALSSKSHLILSNFNNQSIQGDAALPNIYVKLGVNTSFNNGKITLSKIDNFNLSDSLSIDLRNTPDLAQTIVVSCLGLGIGCRLTGLHTLKMKETDRLSALKIEMQKLGAEVHITENSLELLPINKLKRGISIDTYNDHRMAMAFAPLALKVPIIINDFRVVSKSYPSFWEDLKKIKFTQIVN